MFYWKSGALALGVIGSFGLFGQAMAQAPTSSPSDSAQLADVIVTAQQRRQTERDVPMALSVLGETALAERRVETLADLAAFVPGLTVQGKSAADSALVLRGISNADGSSYQEPRVSVFQDGAPMSKARGAFVELFDLERIEVVRGPQTTLFGRNALTGAINLIQHKAEPVGAVSIGLEAGSPGHALLEGMVNTPLTDTLSLRLAGRMREEGGLSKNLIAGGRYGDSRVEAGRLTLSWRPGSNLTSDLILNLERTRGTGQPSKSATFRPSIAETGAVVGDLSMFTGATLAAGAGFDGGRALGLNRRLASGMWLNSWAVAPGLSLSSTTSVRRFSAYEAYDFDGFALPLLTVGDDSFGNQIAQDFRANFDPSPRFSLVGGVSLVRENGAQRIPLQLDERLVLALLTGRLDRRNPVLAPQAAYTDTAVVAAQLRGMALARGATLSQAQSVAIANNLRGDHREVYEDASKSKGADVYVDMEWTPLDRLQLTAGVRYGWLDRTSGLSSAVEGRSVLAGFLGALGQPAAQRQALLGALAVPGAATLPRSATYPVPLFGLRAQPTAGGARQYAGIEDEGAAWRLVARYTLSPTSTVYASYARGRRPRLLSPDTPARPEGDVVFTPVAAETIDSYELGSKTDWPALGLRSGLALYRYDYRHFQTIIQQGATYVTADAGRASATGFEADVRWTLPQGAEMFGILELSRARFEDGLYAGNRLALNSDVKFTLGANLRWDVPGGVLALTPSFAWRSALYFSDDNGIAALTTGAFVAPIDYRPKQEGYGLLNATLNFTPAEGDWSAGLFVRNALDEDFLTDAGNGGEDFGLPTYTRGPGRMIGARLSLRR